MADDDDGVDGAGDIVCTSCCNKNSSYCCSCACACGGGSLGHCGQCLHMQLTETEIAQHARVTDTLYSSTSSDDADDDGDLGHHVLLTAAARQSRNDSCSELLVTLGHVPDGGRAVFVTMGELSLSTVWQLRGVSQAFRGWCTSALADDFWLHLVYGIAHLPSNPWSVADDDDDYDYDADDDDPVARRVRCSSASMSVDPDPLFYQRKVWGDPFTIHLRASSPAVTHDVYPPADIVITSLAGEHGLYINGLSDTVGSLKTQIFAMSGAAAFQQCLHYMDAELGPVPLFEDARTLAQYKTQMGCTGSWPSCRCSWCTGTPTVWLTFRL